MLQMQGEVAELGTNVEAATSVAAQQLNTLEREAEDLKQKRANRDDVIGLKVRVV